MDGKNKIKTLTGEIISFNEICNQCGRSVKMGTSLYSNRVRDSDTPAIRAEKPYPDGDFQCPECAAGIQPTSEGYEGEPPTEEELKKLEECNLRPFDKCGGCDEYWLDLYRQNEYNVEDSHYCEKTDKMVCYGCLESSDNYKNTVVVYCPKSGEVTKYLVGEYEDDVMNNSKEIDPDNLDDVEFDDWDSGECPIQFKYVSTDVWRGYHDPITPEGWTNFHSDCILSMSEDEEELKKFDIDVKKMLWEAGVEFALCYGRTSNLFSCGYDILVKTDEDKLKILLLTMRLQQLKMQYRDPDRFSRTALTGSGEDTKASRLLVKAARMLEEGQDFETVKEVILKEAQE